MSSPATSSLAADPRVRRGMSAQLAARRRRLDAGERSLGWKVGFWSAEAKAQLNIDAPLVGFLADGGLLRAPASVSISGWSAPVLEPEIAAHMGSDLPAWGNVHAAGRAIGSLGPAFELADVDPPPRGVEAILAGNIFQRHVLPGPTDPNVSTRALRGRLTGPGGAERTVEDPLALTEDPIDVVRHVADLLGEFGEALRAGEIVICGSIVPPIPVAPGDAFSYALDPVGEIAIRLEG
jgi:2-keto-4-pentenoate hydratase